MFAIIALHKRHAAVAQALATQEGSQALKYTVRGPGAKAKSA